MVVRSRRGFTLIELLVVIALIGVAMVAMSIGISQGLQAARERQTLRDMVYALRQTRTHAVLSQAPAVLRFDMRQRWFQAPDQPRRFWPASMAVDLTTAAQAGSGLAFYPDGSSSGGHLSVARGGQRWRIDVGWLTGNVRWQITP
ncbi:Tfp pilus assembly protein FimT/FimU [Pseudomonas sp. NPDC087358]|uniref:Tfp pilus assembly protein FimT/FimU n=1 Tax=Pseudomonas sp. NPDC087358 TaxID=3364439 RepID=UPI0038515B0C